MKVFDKGFSLTWLGHSAFHLVSPRGKHVLVDPWIRGNPMTPLGDGAVDQADLLLLTHAHDDHSGDVVRLAGETGCTVVSIVETAGWLESEGVKNVVGMNKGGSTTVHGMRVTMTHATHTSSRHATPGHYLGDAAGFVLRLENDATIYFAGDTGPTMDMQIVGDLYQPDVSVLPIGDFYTMGPREAAYAAKLLRSRWIVPCHWGTFPVLTGTPDALRKELAAMGVTAEVVAPEPGHTLR